MIDFLRASPFLAVAIFFVYEWIAVWTHIVPPISEMVYGQLAAYHPLIQVTLGFMSGVLVLLLILHLTGNLGWWEP
jgi:hypothetical protein